MSLRQWLRNLNNPLRGQDAEGQFHAVQWGNHADREFSLNVPHLARRQDLVQLGKWRRTYIRTRDGKVRVIVAQRPYPFLAFGEADNRIYLAGGSMHAMARAHRFGQPGVHGHVLRTDYDSTKGSRGRSTYYYHDHEEPFALWVVHRDGWPSYLGGGYTVRPEGITD